MLIHLSVLASVVLLPLAAAGEDLASAAEECRAGKAKAREKILKAARHKDAAIRLAAARVLTDAGALADLARSDPSTDVRQAAIENAHLTDPALLASLAGEGNAFKIREAALARVKDPAGLLQLVKADPDSDPSAGIVKRVSDPAALVDVATTAKEGSKSRRAAEAQLPRALLAGIPFSSWGYVRPEDGVSLPALGRGSPVPPGTYAISVWYSDSRYQALAPAPLKLVVTAKACYVILSNALGGTWRPSVKPDRCSAK